jgi:hypothetical protein
VLDEPVFWAGRLDALTPVAAKEIGEDYEHVLYLPCSLQGSRQAGQNTALKRLASAVRFRPWPPHSKTVSGHQKQLVKVLGNNTGTFSSRSWLCPPPLPRAEKLPAPS